MNNKYKIVFMGTPIFAAEILKYLIKEEWNIVGVISQPDKKVGRKREVKLTPVKEIAQQNKIQVMQPGNIREDTSFLEKFEPDIIITAAYGQIVPQEVLDYPKFGCINIHGSLLPKYRGGAPIHYSIINGEDKTGVTIMEMVAKMDAGNIISQQAFPIEIEDTLETVHYKMIEVAKKLITKTLPLIFNREAKSIIQDESLVTYSPNISSSQEIIDWTKDGVQIYNQIRGLNPWPVAYSKINGKRFKFYTTKFIEQDKQNSNSSEVALGTVTRINKEGIFISVNKGMLQVIDFQIEGKKKTNIKDFINGNTLIKEGDVFK